MSNNIPIMPGSRRLMLFGDWWLVEVAHHKRVDVYGSLATNETTGDTITTGQTYKTAEQAFLAVLKAIKDTYSNN